MNFFDDMSRFAGATALIAEDGRTTSFQALAAEADAFGSLLSRRALVFILADSCMPAVLGYLGCLRARCPALLLARDIHPDLLRNLIAIYRPHFLWLPRERASQFAGLAERYGVASYVLLDRGAEPLEVYDELALLMTTSGSTGSPKLVRLSYGNLAANAGAIATYLAIGAEDRAITTLPVNYVYGLSVVKSHLHAGASIVLSTASLTEKRFWELLKAQRATTFSGVPYTFELLHRLGWSRMNLPSLKVLTQAGGKLNASLVREFAIQCLARGIRFYVMYGAAEATARMSYLPPSMLMDKAASIGIAIPGGEFALEGPDNSPIDKPETVGELIYRGPNVSLGYAECRKDLALGDERGGFLRTGDLAKRDGDGIYSIVGRRSRFVKLFGNRVNLEDVEQLLRNANIECACTGNDQVLTIHITDASRQEEVLSSVLQWTKLPRAALRTAVTECIPRNEAGKITYARLA